MSHSSSAPVLSPSPAPWRPGLWGKGFFDANGTVYLWATAVGATGHEPTRGVAGAALAPGLRSSALKLTGGHLEYLTPISIRPDGVYHVATERGDWEAAVSAHPELEHDARFDARRFSELDTRLRHEPDHDAWLAVAIQELH
jgi:hypothetical protein